MAPRRRGRWVLILAAILIVAGLFAVLTAVSPGGTQDTAALAPNDVTNGTEYFAEYDWSVLAGGSVQGSFHVLDNTSVTVFVFNDADYNSYVNGANLTGLYTTTASNGTIDLQVSGWNTYHVVFAHGPSYGAQEQDVAVTLATTGIDPGFFLGGIAAILIGAILVVYIVLRARRPQPASPYGVLDSRATYLPPTAPPAGPDTATSAGGMYRVPPPLPGASESGQPPAGATTAAAAPVGNVVVSLANASAAPENVQLIVNGAPVTTVAVPPGTTQTTTITARLASPFGSMVTVQAVTSSGRRAEQSVFVGAHGTAQVALRVA